jgi:hypothetical protein
VSGAILPLLNTPSWRGAQLLLLVNGDYTIVKFESELGVPDMKIMQPIFLLHRLAVLQIAYC